MTVSLYNSRVPVDMGVGSADERGVGETIAVVERVGDPCASGHVGE